MYQPSSKEFVYYKSQDQQKEQQKELSRDVLNKLLHALAREAIREKTPELKELDRVLREILTNEGINVNELSEDATPGKQGGIKGEGDAVVRYLMNKGYLKEGKKWLSKQGFMNIGSRILTDVMKALKSDDLGLHETMKVGSGTTVLDTSRKYEAGGDIRLLNVPKSLLNTIERIMKSYNEIRFPLDIDVDDFEEYETIQEVRVTIAYCIDLSSTMRYSSMMGEVSRIEAAKRALWSLYVLNRKFFPTDTIYIIGFGALASKVLPQDIPYLKTFEPGHDFLHYTNYQAAFRLASKILQRDGALNKRIVLVTDGHPSACFVDNEQEKDKILSARPYSHFYRPDDDSLDSVRKNQDLEIDMSSGELVYLCYRYRQVDPYIGMKTINEAKRCRSAGIEIDTLMVSEEDALLSYVNDMEKQVKGRSYYINPLHIDKLLITDYLSNKRRTVSTRSF
ncbi:MAG: VWA domain-containing protein [Nitrososphaerales archaeon]